MPGTHGSGCGCKHESELTGGEFLYGYVDKDGVRGLNEQVPGSAKTVIRTYEDRLRDNESCCSELDDPELIIYIPFKSPCKVSSMHLIGGSDGAHPSSVYIFANRDDLDFTNITDTTPIQKIDLSEDYHGALEYPMKVTKLQNVNSLTMYFTGNFGGDHIQLFYVGLRGQGSTYQRKAVQTVYESRPNLKDHKLPGDSIAPQMGL